MISERPLLLKSGDAMPDSLNLLLCVKTAAFLYLKYEMQEALKLLEKAQGIPYGGNPFLDISILSIKSGIKEELGDLTECEALYQKIFSMMQAHKFLDHLSFNFHIGATGIYLKTGRLEFASDALDNAASSHGRTDIWSDGGYLYNLMELKLMQGEKDEAYTLLQKLLELDFYHNTLYTSSLIKYLDYMGKLTPELVKGYKSVHAGCEPRFLRAEDHIAFARIQYYVHNIQQAIKIADDVLEVLRSRKIKVRLIETLLFKCDVLSGNDITTHRERMNLFREAVYYAPENHIASPFMLEGQKIDNLVRELCTELNINLNYTEKNFLNELAQRFSCIKPVDILSDREMEVLKELAKGASNKEIGEILFISLSTVKTHVINIYSKLGAKNRVEAVEKVGAEKYYYEIFIN